ncbi:MAG TPA: hypothetical protein VHM01_20575 [Alphaproteobacteria bacterium]|nr:hypothetical protein [Alphaproteobacteria bacterium]
MFRRSRTRRLETREAARDDDVLRDPAVRRIDNAAQYQGAIGEALGRARARPGTPQAERLDALIAAVEDYEARHGHEIAHHERLSVSIRRLRAGRGLE